jgi:lipopolysaccharide transport system ATP-binding protein
MTTPIIDVRGLGKEYERRTLVPVTLREATGNSLRNLIGRLTGRVETAGVEISEFWALRDVSFTVEPGEVVGVIGPNGAGKSTLLKVLARITAPTQGTVDIRGNVTALLQLGAGFHPELTGRENVILAGAARGRLAAEVRARMDEIVEFAGVGAVIDEPLKHYSDGMRMRLGFSVAVQFVSDVLLIDEVFSAGDVAFHEKASARLVDMIKSGVATLLVSHDLEHIEEVCTKVCYMSGGRLVEVGPPDGVIERYLANQQDKVSKG